MEPLGRCRYAHASDAPAVLALVNESMAETFRVNGTGNIVYLIENCVISICLLNESEKIVGFLAGKDYPLIPSVHPRAWEDYVWLKYKAIELNSRNTLFLHMLCWEPAYARDAVDRMLRSLFMHDAYLHHVCVIKTVRKFPLLIPGQSRGEASFRRLYSSEKGVPGDMLPILCVADRSEVCPRLRVRRAVEEDNDDIVPIIERHSSRLQQMYGEFYISELVARHPESDRVLLVCEHKEVAVGVMCLNTQVNLESLEEHYELSPFAGLRHLDAKPISENEEESGLSFLSHRADMGSQDQTSMYDSMSMRVSPRRQKMKMSTVDDDDPKAHFHWRTSYSLGNAFLDYLQMLDDDKEELDYEIVNIDSRDMRVPTELDYDRYQLQADEITKTNLNKNCSSVEEPPKPRKSFKSTDFATHMSPEARRYSGTSNAFLLELFAMHPDYDERYGFDILETAYELFPDREYCVLCLPSTFPAFPLLEHFTNVSPYRCQTRFIQESLYVAHVNSVRGKLRVRFAEAHDLVDMADTMEHAQRRQFLVELFEASINGRDAGDIESCVVLSENMPVGVVILGPQDDSIKVRAKYNLNPEPVRAGTDGSIIAGIITPLLEPHMRWIIRELLRLTKYTSLFWICRLVAKFDLNPCRNLMSMAAHMVPCRPRLVLPNISRDKELDVIHKDTVPPYVLWYTERQLTSLPKVDVNNSIVVIGASRTGLAFLEALFMGPTSPYLTFTNVTLISEHGLPTVADCLKAAETCCPNDGRYTDKYMKSVPFYYYIDVISAVVTKIDRKQKFVQLKTGGTKYYDTLVLTCGRQFQHPHYLKDSLELEKELLKGEPCKRILMDSPKFQPAHVTLAPPLPYNMMLINSLYDANVCLRRVARIVNELRDTKYALSATNPVIVYGNAIETYGCLAALLELGLPPSVLCLVELLDADAVPRINCFNNETVDERVQKSITGLGVVVHRRCLLSKWETREGMATSATFISELKQITINTFAMFYFGPKAIDIYSLKAIMESGLVYDGAVVIGPDFETNDPNVVAAGTCTKYSRKLRATRWEHRYFCSEDVGEALAEIFLKKLDPFVSCNPAAQAAEPDIITNYASSINFGVLRSTMGFLRSSPSTQHRRRSDPDAYRRWARVRKFKTPLVKFATLPGPLYYLKMVTPGPDVPMEVRMSLPNQGHVMITDKKGNYFRLRVNEYHAAEAATHLSREPISPEVISRMHGMHQAFFHHILARHKMGMIDDLYEYLMQPWMAVLYQEMFDQLLSDIQDQKVGTVFDLAKSRFNLDGIELEGKAGEESTARPSDIPQCGFGPLDAEEIGTFRDIVMQFVTKADHNKKYLASDKPYVCGQNPSLRAETAAFWEATGGDSIVMAHLIRYLHYYAIANPHYARAF